MPIIRATINDVVDLTTLVNSAYRGESSTKGWTTEAHLLDGIRIDESTMSEYLGDDNIIILKYVNESGDITGCVYLEVQGQKLYLGMLTVSPVLQTNGIGKQLLLEAEKIAVKNNCSAIYMTVITTRKELIEWYERRGYLPTGEILPFHNGTRFGTPKELIQLSVFEKAIRSI